MQSKPPSETEVVESSTEKKDKAEVSPAPATPVVVPPAPPTPPAPPAEDYRTKFGMSTRENQVLQGELEGLKQTLGEITKEEIPSDEEMVQKYPEFEFAEPLMQSVLKRQEVLERRIKKGELGITRVLGSVQRRNELAAVVATNAALRGKEEAFITFASDPNRQNAPVATLVSAFLYEVKDETPAPVVVTPPAPETPPAPPAPAKDDEAPAPVLERGTPSGGEPPKPPVKTERTAEELKELRTSNPKEYNRLLRLGQL